MSRRVLLVDDDLPVLNTLKAVFETKDFEVTTASSAKDATHKLARASFDLVVTDMRMETDTSGYEVVRSAKQQNNNPVVVILSAYPISPADWRQAGADAMFMKGGGVFRILEEIERLLRSSASQRQSA